MEERMCRKDHKGMPGPALDLLLITWVLCLYNMLYSKSQTWSNLISNISPSLGPRWARGLDHNTYPSAFKPSFKAFLFLVCRAWKFLSATSMTVFVWKLLENTNCIYLMYRVYPALPKNKSIKAVFDSDDMILYAQCGLLTSSLSIQSTNLFLFSPSPASALKFFWVIPALIYSHLENW